MIRKSFAVKIQIHYRNKILQILQEKVYSFSCITSTSSKQCRVVSMLNSTTPSHPVYINMRLGTNPGVGQQRLSVKHQHSLRFPTRVSDAFVPAVDLKTLMDVWMGGSGLLPSSGQHTSFLYLYII